MLSSPTRPDDGSLHLAAHPKEPASAADPLPDADAHAGLRAQQLYHVVASIHALRSQMHDHSGVQSEFASQLEAALTQAAAPLDAMVLRAFTQPRALPSPLRDHWSVLAANRQLVAQIASKESDQLSDQAHGLAQIRLCLTAQLQTSTEALKAAVQQHKSDSGIDGVSASEIPLPADLLNLRQRCAAMHADVRKIDSELHSMHAKKRQYEEMQGQLQERRTPNSSPYAQQHSSVQKAARSPALVSLHSTPSSLASRHSTPISSAASPSSAPSSASSAASSAFSASSHSSPASDLRNTSQMPLLHFSPILPPNSAAQSPATQSRPADDDVRSAPPTPQFASPSAVPRPAAQDRSAETDEPSMQLLFAKLGAGSPWRAETESEVTPAPAASETENIDHDQPGLTISICPPCAITLAAETSSQPPTELSSPIPPAEMRPLSSVSPLTTQRHAALIALDPLSPRLATPQQQLLSRAPTSPLRSVTTEVVPSPVVPLSARSPSVISPQLQAQLDTPFSALKKRQQQLHSASPLPPSSLSLLLRQQEEEEQRLEAKARYVQLMKQMADENQDVDKLYDDDESDQEESEDPVRCLYANDIDEDLDSSAPIPAPQSLSARPQDESRSHAHVTPLRSGWQASFEMRSNPHLHSLRSTLQSFTDSTHAMMESPAPSGPARAMPTPPSSSSSDAPHSSAKALLRRVQRINSENQSKQQQQAGDLAAVAAEDRSKAPLPAAAASGPSSKSASPSEWFDVPSSRLPLRDITNELVNGAWLHSPIDQAAGGGGAGMAHGDENEPGNLVNADSPLRYSFFRPQVAAAVAPGARRREVPEARTRAARQPEAAAAAMVSPVAAAPGARPASAPSSAASSAPSAGSLRVPARRSLGARAPAATAAAAAATASASSSASAVPSSVVPSSSSSSSSSSRRKSGEQRARPAGTIVAPIRPRPASAASSAAKPKSKPSAAAASASVPIRIPASLQTQPQLQAQATLASVRASSCVSMSCPSGRAASSSASQASGVENPEMPD